MIMDLLFFRIICRSIHLNLNKRIVHNTQYYDFFLNILDIELV